VQRFLDAAFELMQNGESAKNFTVQEVVERSGQSLRSFYQYFGGKQELLLALFEEIVRATAQQVRDRIGDTDDPGERLHRFVVEYYRVCRPAGRGRAVKNGAAPALAEFAQQLLTAQPAAAAQAFSPLASLFEEVLGEATTAGIVRADLQTRGVTGIVLEAIMFNSFSATIAGLVSERDGTDPAEELWEFILHGIAGAGLSREPGGGEAAWVS
jgi:AcrR family transcriptional regulator